MRRQTRTAAINVLALKADRATRIQPDGTLVEVPLQAIAINDLVLVRPGERVSVDGVVTAGQSRIDQSLVTGETRLEEIAAGSHVFAGTMNLGGALQVRVQAAAKGTLIDEVATLLDTATAHRSRYIQLADRAARLYSPVVHLTAILTLIGWIAAGLAWQQSLIIAITVLIITCPCALGLGHSSRSGRSLRGALPCGHSHAFRRCTGATGRYRHGGFRQDRNPHPARSSHCQCG